MNNQNTSAVALIVGAGPAGLTAATELQRNTTIHPIVVEESDAIGGISRTVRYHGNRMDIGGHRFFSRSERVNRWWLSFLPMQGAPALDDRLLSRSKPLSPAGPDPDLTDEVMLTRDRISRIFYLRAFFDYPISLKYSTFAGMGLWRTVKAGTGYVAAALRPREEKSLEDFYINRFGRPLYSMFFEDYTQKVWGLHPSRLGGDWGAQRVKGLSVTEILKDMLMKGLRRKPRHVETSLIESFIYPKLGPGQLWETVAGRMEQAGGELRMNERVTAVHVAENQVDYVETVSPDGTLTRRPCDYLFSSMPLKDFVASLTGIEVPQEVRQVAAALPYRDFITVGLLVKELKFKNKTHVPTYDWRIPDTWIYIQERDVKIGRLQVFNNWSPYLVKDYENTMWIGLEYFCNEGDDMWNMSEQDFIGMAIAELVKIGFVNRDDVLDATQVKVKKAYPAYHGTYYELDLVRAFLDGISNLYCIGRNGQHRYNNMDHSMLTAMKAVDAIVAGTTDKAAVWSVNTEEEYHESK